MTHDHRVGVPPEGSGANQLPVPDDGVARASREAERARLALDSAVRAATPAYPRPPAWWIAMIAVVGLVAGVLGGAAGYVLADTSGPTSSLPPVPEAVPIAQDGTVAAVAEVVLPSVVAIDAVNGGIVIGSGSGFVIDAAGYILTNEHVIDASDGEVRVVYSDGVVESAEIVGKTSDYDLAVLRVEREGLTPLVLGDSSALVVGEPVIAIGSPLGLDATVTTGIVSSVHRPVGGISGGAFIDAIQTDAAINPGNSGGPLLNYRGQVVGINSAIAALPGATQQTGAGSVGLGFAIPSDQARRTATEIIETGFATYPVVGVLLDEAYLGQGVKVVDDDPAQGVVAVSPGGPADRAGIEAGDVITALDGRPMTRAVELVVAIRAYAPGDEVTLTVIKLNDGTTVELTMTLVANTTVNYQDGATEEPSPGP